MNFFKNEPAIPIPINRLHQDLISLGLITIHCTPTANAANPTIDNDAHAFLLALLLGLI